MFAKYLVVNTASRLISALRSTLFLFLFGLSHDLGVTLYVVAMVSQALVFGSIYDIIACKWSFSSDNRWRLNRLGLGFFALSLAIFAVLIALSDKSALNLSLEFLLPGVLALITMYAFGYEVTRARSVGKNIATAYAQAIVSFSFLAAFIPLSFLMDERAILPSMALSNLIGWVALRIGRSWSAASQEAIAAAASGLPAGRSLVADFIKSGAVYFLFSLLHTIDKVIGGYLLDRADLAGYLMAFSLLMMLRASLNVEQYFASELRAKGAEHGIAARSVMIVTVFTAALLVLENEVTAVVKVIGRLDPAMTYVFASSFRTLLLAWPVLTFIAVINRTDVGGAGPLRIAAGTVLAFGIWLIPVSFGTSHVGAVALTFFTSTAVFAGILFVRYLPALGNRDNLLAFSGVALAYGYAWLTTPVWLDVSIFATISIGLWRSFKGRRSNV